MALIIGMGIVAAIIALVMIYKLIRCCTRNIRKSNIEEIAPRAGKTRTMTMGEKERISLSNIMISKHTLGEPKTKLTKKANMITTKSEKARIGLANIMISKHTVENPKTKPKKKGNMIADLIQDQRASCASDDIFQTAITDRSSGEL